MTDVKTPPGYLGIPCPEKAQLVQLVSLIKDERVARTTRLLEEREAELDRARERADGYYAEALASFKALPRWRRLFKAEPLRSAFGNYRYCYHESQNIGLGTRYLAGLSEILQAAVASESVTLILTPKVAEEFFALRLKVKP